MASGRAGSAPAPPSSQGLARELGFFSLTASGVGIIIGAGIYVLVGTVAGEAGNGVWLAFLLAAALSALTGMGYCELAAMFPRAAAEFEYSRHAFPAWVAFLTGWVMIAGLSVGAAAVALGFAQYLSEFVDLPSRAGAYGLLALVTLVALGGIRNSIRVTICLSLVQVAGLLLVVFVGAPHIGDTNLFEGATVGGVGAAAALVFFAFIGFDEVATLAEETKNPGRTVPLALLAGLAISTVLYVAVAVVSVSVLPASELASANAPLASVVRAATGQNLDSWISAIALVSTTNTTLLILTAGSRVIYGMAEARAFPSSLGGLFGRRQSPARSILVATTIAAVFVGIGDLKLAASLTDFSVYLVFLSVNATVTVLRFRMPNAKRPFRMPGSIARVPLTAAAGFITTLLLMSRLEVEAIAVGAMMAGSGLALGYLIERRTGWASWAATGH